jgi:acetyl esterase/lipase
MKYLICGFTLIFALVFCGLASFAGDPPRPDEKPMKNGATGKIDEKKKDDKTSTPFEVETKSDIAYRSDSDSDPDKHKLDLYLPKGQKGFPVVFFVHGGSWRTGDKKEYKALGEMLAGQGVGAVIVNYRLSPQVQHPGHIQDVAKAFAWTHEHIAKYGGKPDRIIVCGHSAGGQLVSLLATDDQYLKDEKLARSDIRGVIAISGVHAMPVPLPMFHKVFGKGRDALRDASPLYHVQGELPPFLLLYADHDALTLPRVAEEMKIELKKNNTDVICKKIEKRNHVSIITEMVNESDPTREAVFDFIGKQSDWKPAPTKSPMEEKKPSP